MKKITSKSVGLKIRALRESHGMSGKALSLLLGISQQHQSRYENGEVNIHVDTLFQLAQIFDVDATYFFSDINIDDNITNDTHCKKNFYVAETVIF
ncbi:MULTISPECIES: helix-turn-helix domain-containing protein [Providencia]|uniref:helix-turn-helix domain-containing protein n=1 Tax=Providencia TaxID=586 RepID=UPI0008394B6F|nr:helix-turn-helix transcriptional regulator [Providencia heimbachae]MBP6121599.1 helix-turn-helix transcriptional regulator [Providencia sp.]NIH20998.1 helix-turn-helix transcriptional regulator [Providencia heimbachae]